MDVFDKEIEQLNYYLQQARQAGNRRGEGQILLQIGEEYYSHLAYEKGRIDYVKAIEYLKQAIEIFHLSGDWLYYYWASRSLGSTYEGPLRDPQTALKTYQTAIDEGGLKQSGFEMIGYDMSADVRRIREYTSIALSR